MYGNSGVPSRRQRVSFPPPSHALPRHRRRPHPRHHGGDGAQIQDRGPPGQRRPAQRPRRGKEGPARCRRPARPGSRAPGPGGPRSTARRGDARRRSAGGFSAGRLSAGLRTGPLSTSKSLHSRDPALPTLCRGSSRRGRRARAQRRGRPLRQTSGSGLRSPWRSGRLCGEVHGPGVWAEREPVGSGLGSDAGTSGAG